MLGYLQPICVTLDFKLFIDSIHILFLLYLLLWLWDFNIKNLQDFIKIYRALIKDIFPVAELSDYISRKTFDALIGESSEALAKEAFQRMDVPFDLSCALLESWRVGA